ncbi:amidohydrolase [Kribbella sp. NPDC050124]|uniref:amidohydrolase n=1 Tax=Kribbella sp. NPDC050124 TaxID=3364114 RepID=UPI00379521E2
MLSTERESISNTPDLVVVGGRVRCARGRWAGGIAIAGDRIAAIGTADEIRALAGRGTQVIEAAGGLVLPGFQDAHVHAPFAGRNRLRIWLNDAVGRREYLDLIAAYADAHPEQTWILGGGWALEAFPGGLPTREDLDRVVPDRPVFLFNRDVHGAWVNTRALELAGIDKYTPDPSDGRIERDPATGEPTGMLHEGAAYQFNDDVVPAPDRVEWESAILEAQSFLHALGITGWQDAWVTPATLNAYRSLADDGRLTARVVGALWWDRYRELDQIDDLLAQRELGSGRHPRDRSERFLPTSVKIMTDGVLENYTGALLEPYCDGCGGHTTNRGLSFVDRELLAAAVTELDRHGFQVHMHAIGDRAVRNALDAVEAARTANGPSDQRHHIAHVQLIQPDDIGRFAELDVVVNCQAYWAKTDPQMTELTVPFLGPKRVDLQYPFESLRRAGARLAMGSDWSVTTADPLQQIEVAVTRTDPESRSDAPFLPDERLSIDDAVDAFTAGSAYVNHDDDGGTLTVGGRADLAILDQDVLAARFASADRFPASNASVRLTVAAGKVVHERQA